MFFKKSLPLTVPVPFMPPVREEKPVRFNPLKAVDLAVTAESWAGNKDWACNVPGTAPAVTTDKAIIIFFNISFTT
jgi:hypothetical protein